MSVCLSQVGVLHCCVAIGKISTETTHRAFGLRNHASASKRCYIQPLDLPLALPLAQSSSGTLTSHALLAQTSLEHMTSVGCRHQDRIYVFTRIFGRCKPIYLCHSDDPTNPQAILQMLPTATHLAWSVCMLVSFGHSRESYNKYQLSPLSQLSQLSL